MSKDLMDMNVNDGLATLLEAGEFIPDDKADELAEKARKEAEVATSEYRRKHHD
ncbi:hypothetical protein [Enterobacter sp. CGMCC 5087]|uniref:hypothetical protein n=1 Tax=Enterobacter sp. CGMCC 5087 TaxID=2183878 RepID=UPI0015E81748|nr:hypothetical protein [Enterobacter sp. CGMCC 5087]